jgi:transcriptional regulator NrdR family protein
MNDGMANRGIRCGNCGRSKLRVIYTRHRNGGRIVRRRECKVCGRRVTTCERESLT